MNNNIRLIIAAILGLIVISASAEVKLAPWIGNGMVLQREVEATLSGTATPGEVVKVTFKKKTYESTADNEGKWKVSLPKQKAGGPYTISIGGREISDVLFGDVFLCSGQSNMELPVERVTDMFADEVAQYENASIRFFTVPKVTNFHAPQTDIPATEWKTCTPASVMSVSALGYFFAKELNAQTGVPVGIVVSAWGGTPIEAWVSEETISAYPLALAEKKLYEDDRYCKEIKVKEGQDYAAWNRVLYAMDPGKQASPQWSKEAVDDSDWTEVDMFDEWIDTRDLTERERLNTSRSDAGSYWLRKTVDLPASMARQKATLRLGCIVDADSVWVNGTFVGNVTYMYPPRIYTIPEGVLREGRNVVVVRVVSNGGKPSFVREKPYKIIVGNEEVSLEGAWKYRRGAVTTPAPSMMFFCYKPVCLYNAMLSPLRDMQVSGAVWYQGESNVGREEEYALLLPDLMTDWRRTFAQPQMPFYIIELAGFLAQDDPDQPAWMRFRDMQREVAEKEQLCEVIYNRDLGEWNDIHPLDKKTLAQRLVDKVLPSLTTQKKK